MAPPQAGPTEAAPILGEILRISELPHGVVCVYVCGSPSVSLSLSLSPSLPLSVHKLTKYTHTHKHTRTRSLTQTHAHMKFRNFENFSPRCGLWAAKCSTWTWASSPDKICQSQCRDNLLLLIN